MTPCCPMAFLGVAMPLLPHTPSPCPMQSALGAVLPCCPHARQGTSGGSPGSAAQAETLSRDSSRLQPHSHPLHTSRDTPGRCSSQVPGRQESPGKSRRYQHHHPAHHPSPAWSCPQRARAHRPWCQAWHCPAGSPLRRAAQAGWGAAYLLPHDVGSVGPGTGLQTPRVGLTPRFESVQEAAYQRSCCLCRFLSLLLPHPA